MYEDIKQQFRAVIEYTQGIPDPQIDDLFMRWEQAKEKFIQRFGGLVYEWPHPVEVTLDPLDQRSKASNLVEYVDNVFHNTELAEFIDMNLDTFFENTVSSTYGGRVPAGMKLIKAFKFFEDDKKRLRDIQDLASTILQENKLVGTLCFSVHPLDFLSSSENTYNWRSCHALDGEYRAGNLSYMVDTTTFMVYIKGENQMRFCPTPGKEVLWNSKKWRMLIHSADNDEIMFAGRQYPFNTKSGIDLVLNIYNVLLCQSYPYCRYYDWRADYIDSYVPYDCNELSNPIELNSKYIIFANQLIALDEIVKAGNGALNYNDILCSSCYKYPYYTIFNPYGRHNIYALKEHPISIGAHAMCLHCGKETISNAETMRCDDCEMSYGYEENDTYGSCACCGGRIYIDDAPEVGRYNELVCDFCYSNLCFICDECGEAYFNEDKNYVTYDEDRDGYLCPCCYEDFGG